MKVYIVQWKYHDDTMTCGIFNSLAMAKDAQEKVINGLHDNFFREQASITNVNVYEWELDTIVCEEAGFTLGGPSGTRPSPW